MRRRFMFLSGVVLLVALALSRDSVAAGPPAGWPSHVAVNITGAGSPYDGSYGMDWSDIAGEWLFGDFTDGASGEFTGAEEGGGTGTVSWYVGGSPVGSAIWTTGDYNNTVSSSEMSGVFAGGTVAVPGPSSLPGAASSFFLWWGTRRRAR